MRQSFMSYKVQTLLSVVSKEYKNKDCFRSTNLFLLPTTLATYLSIVWATIKINLLIRNLHLFSTIYFVWSNSYKISSALSQLLTSKNVMINMRYFLHKLALATLTNICQQAKAKRLFFLLVSETTSWH